MITLDLGRKPKTQKKEDQGSFDTDDFFERSAKKSMSYRPASPKEEV